MAECLHEVQVRRIDAGAARRLAADPRTLVLDVRRPEAFEPGGGGLPGAVPLLLEPETQRIPDVDRARPVLVYCLCSGEASSMRAALWLTAAGYRDVSVLRGGLPAWREAGLALSPVAPDAGHALAWQPAGGDVLAGDPMVAERVFMGQDDAPTRRDIAVVFVDMVDSTGLMFRHAPERTLQLVQDFMSVVVDTAVRHCGDIHDFEGDGAMIYFAGVGEALPAVFELREALDARRREEPELPQARFAVTTGPVVIGYIGTRMRRTVAFIGPCVNAAARILRLAEPGGIVAAKAVLAQGRQVAPALAGRFSALAEAQPLKGWQQPVRIFAAVPGA